MSSMNWGRVILGALQAGIVTNVVEFILNGVVLARGWAAAMAALGIPPVAVADCRLLCAATGYDFK